MRKHIFFKKIPDKGMLERLVACFGILFFGENISFTKDQLLVMGTLEKVCELVNDLRQHYIPCKARLYLENLNIQKCITILRQILKLHSCYLSSIQKMKFGTKRVYYTIIWPDNSTFIKKQVSPCILSFA